MDVIKPLLNTIFLISVLLIPGVILLIFNNKKILPKMFLVSGVFLLCLLGFAPLSNYLCWCLESKYPPLMDLRGYEDAKHIVVLTAWDTDQQTIPYIQNLGSRSAFRILEGHRIYREIPDSKIIISGSPAGGNLMSSFLILLGVPQKDIMIDLSANTLTSALAIKNLLQDKRFFLVTSAAHMPRAILSFSRQGLKPIPAPSDYVYGYYKSYNFPLSRPIYYYLPNTDAFMRSSAALYEYFGLVLYQSREYAKRFSATL